MQIEKVEIERLRAFESVTVEFNDYTCLVGANGAGKSTVLCALNIFFRQTEDTGTNLQSLEKEDFFKGDTSKPIRVRVTFSDLSADALESFKDYARNGKLVVTAEATFNEGSGRADVRHYGERSAMPQFKDFFAALGDGATATELKPIYEKLRDQFPDLARWTSKDASVAALRAYEADRPNECVLIPSEDQFYGVSKGANRLQAHVQWVYVPAVKDALTEQVEAKNSALGKLLARTVRAKTNFAERLAELRTEASAQYQALLDANQSTLDEISKSLSGRLAEWSHQNATLKLEWQQDREKSVRIEEPWAHVKVGEGPFEGQLARLGHGLQRSYIIALLQELAVIDGPDSPKLLLAIEEPELYQHPPQARHLADVLLKLSQENSQVMVSTHSPYFVSGEVFEDVRVVRRPARDGGSSVTWSTFDDVAARVAATTGKPLERRAGAIAKLQQILEPHLAELFFASKVVFVEGREDSAFLQTQLELSGRWDEFRKHGGHIIPTYGKDEILKPLIVAQITNIPTFVIFDADGNETEPNRRALHERDNVALLKALGADPSQPFPPATLKAKTHVVWPTYLGAVVKDSVDEAAWRKAQEAADREFEHTGGLAKNAMHIAYRLESLWTAGHAPKPLLELVDAVMEFAAA